MHKWYVLQVLSSHESKVKRNIAEQILHQGMREFVDKILVPTENVSEVRKGEQMVVEKRLWPGYILIKMLLTDDSWQFINDVNGVVGFLGGDKPTALSEKEVKDIMSDLEEKQHTVTQKHKFQVGDTVKIIEGVFVNFIGTVTEVFHDKGKLSVRVSIFGRETQVDDLEFVQVEEANEDDLNEQNK